ncbi:hypothetical protein OPV22_026131 [Ensete ventricosum]|uniref:Major facilitator superfamily (MFS) profile domain-containing protein n=1 Tax=Ensete ventricosum TaxID=4639 RepID=A0AAV8QL40_ENSVE|nr:hypothetical protein OPV22_026131 [Ensete ventricosum]
MEWRGAALMNAVILGVVSVTSALVSTFLVDRCGHKLLFIVGGALMILCQVAMAWILGTKTGSDGQAALPRGYAVAVLMLMCLFSAAFGFSWSCPWRSGRRGSQPLRHLLPDTVLPRHAVRLQARHFHLLFRLGYHHDGLRRRLPAGDQRGCSGVLLVEVGLNTYCL